jgi:hypothetical protein
MTSIEKIALLRHMLFGLEKDLGVEDLSAVKRDILYAVSLLNGRHEAVETDHLRKHDLLAGVTRSTFFNALRSLVEENHLEHVNGSKRSHYMLSTKNKE